MVTGVGYDTNNVQTGNIGAEFDVGVAIGNPGSGSDFFNAFSFTVEAAGLDVTDFFGQSFAARGQSVGAGPDGGEGSSKMFGTASRVLPPPDAQPPAVPLPAGAVLLISGLVTMGGLRARRKAAPLG